MSKQGKKEQKIRKNIKNVSINDFEALINKYGHIEYGANHPKAVIGNTMFPYKRENPVKPAYVEGLLKIIDSLE
jgi:hypothetical protein